jgi:hypothetical protein
VVAFRPFFSAGRRIHGRHEASPLENHGAFGGHERAKLAEAERALGRGAPKLQVLKNGHARVIALTQRGGAGRTGSIPQRVEDGLARTRRLDGGSGERRDVEARAKRLLLIVRDVVDAEKSLRGRDQSRRSAFEGLHDLVRGHRGGGPAHELALLRFGQCGGYHDFLGVQPCGKGADRAEGECRENHPGFRVHAVFLVAVAT